MKLLPFPSVDDKNVYINPKQVTYCQEDAARPGFVVVNFVSGATVVKGDLAGVAAMLQDDYKSTLDGAGHDS